MYADGYKYWLAYKAGSTSYYRCCRHISTKCPGRCMNENGKVRITTEHNHPPEPNRVIIDRFRKALTHRAATENTELHVIYCEEAIARYSDAAMLYPFITAESAMRKARRKQLPQTPKTVNDIINVLNRSDLFRVNSGQDKDPLYQKTITSEDCICMIFMHRKTVELFGRFDELHIDGSFEFISSTQPTCYMVTVHVIQGQITAPIIYAILTAKTRSGYNSLFDYIRDELKIVPNIIVSDFDQTMQTSLSYKFPESIIKGCWFQYTDAVLAQMKNLDLQRETSKGIGASALRMLLVLPLLPPEYMNPGLETLKKWMKEKNIFSKSLSDLCNYIEYRWLKAVGTEKMSVFGTAKLVSNHIKNFNKELSNIIAVQNPVIWVILDSLTQLATKIYVRTSKRLKTTKGNLINSSNSVLNQSVNSNGVGGRNQKKSELVTDTIISNATQLWIKTPVHLRNTLQFLQLTSHFLNDSLYLTHLSDTKETNQVAAVQQQLPSTPVILSTPPSQSSIQVHVNCIQQQQQQLPPQTQMSSASIANYQHMPSPLPPPSPNWIQQKQCTMQHSQLSQEESLEFIQQQTQIMQSSYVDINDPDFMQDTHHLGIPDDGNAFASCFIENDIPTMDIREGHPYHHDHINSIIHQHQIQLSTPEEVHLHSGSHLQQSHQETLPVEILNHSSTSSSVMANASNEEVQSIVSSLQQHHEQSSHHSSMLALQQHSSSDDLYHQSSAVVTRTVSSLNNQSTTLSNRQSSNNVQQILTSATCTEPPPLVILPHVKHLPAKRRLPLLVEPPPLVPIGSKNLTKPP